MGEFQQQTIPGIPEKEPGKHFIPTKTGGNLTAKMKAFVVEYLQSNDLAASAIKAGYAPKHAQKIANRLVHKSSIAELIKQHEEEALRKAGVSRVRALIELTRLAYANPRNLYREDNTLKDPNEWDDDTAAAIASIEVFEEFEGKGQDRKFIGLTKKVKQWNKNEALRNLLQHLGLLIDKKELMGPNGEPLIIEIIKFGKENESAATQ